MAPTKIGRTTLAVSLLALGAALLVNNLTAYEVFPVVQRVWPAILIFLGLEALLKQRAAELREANSPGWDVGSLVLLATLVAGVLIAGPVSQLRGLLLEGGPWLFPSPGIDGHEL